MDKYSSLFTLVFTSELSNSVRSIQCYLPINSVARQVSLQAGLKDACERGIALKNSQIFYMDFGNRMNVFLGVYPFNNEVCVNLQGIISSTIQIVYRNSSVASGQMVDETKEESQVGVKSKKVKERTIKQAIQAVQMWRAYYDTPDNETGRRLYTLDEAAKKVGIAKKTLDDYYNHLRIAKQFDFHLEKFLGEKVGILRRFVKLAKQGGKQALQQLMPSYILETNIQIYWNRFNDV